MQISSVPLIHSWIHLSLFQSNKPKHPEKNEFYDTQVGGWSPSWWKDQGQSVGITQTSADTWQVGNEERWTGERLFLEDMIRGATETADGIKQMCFIVPSM